MQGESELYEADSAEFENMRTCYYCGLTFCNEECYPAMEAQEYAIAEHVRSCTKAENDEYCKICNEY